MFAAGNPGLLRVLREFRVKKTRQPHCGASRIRQLRHPSHSLFSLFPQKHQSVNPICSTSSTLLKKGCSPNYPSINNLRTLLQNTGRWGVCRVNSRSYFELRISYFGFDSSRSPVQRHRPIHRVHHCRARAPRLQQVRLQSEIPLRRPVRVINQHQPRIVLQSLSLQDHRLLVLPQKLLRKNPENPNRKQQIPSRHKINPAKIATHRRNRRPARKPQLPAPNLFRPDIRQNKVDGSRHRLAGIFLQHPVWRAVRAWRMGTHPKSIRNRLELFFLLMNAMPAPPVPRLMHKRSMRRIHQPNNSLVHMRRQLASQMRDPIFLAKRSQLRCPCNRRPIVAATILCEPLCTLRLCVVFFLSSAHFAFTRRLSRYPRTRIHVHPEISITFFARIMPRKNALHFQFVLASQRRNFDAASAASLKFPPVITALHRLPVKSPVRKRNSPVRTRIAHRKRFPFGCASQNQRHFKQHRGRKLVARDFRASQRRIPKVPKKACVVFRCSFAFLKCSLQNRSNRFAHSFFPPPSRANPSRPFKAAPYCCTRRLFTLKEPEGLRRTAPRQRHRSISPRIAATAPSIQLRRPEFSDILGREQIDVRHLLLADLASLALVASSLVPSLLTTHHSLPSFKKDLPWP
jgi:hypothetical protein